MDDSEIFTTFESSLKTEKYMALTCEELQINKIENGIRGIKMGTKSPEEVDLTTAFKKLRVLNKFMCEDLEEKHRRVVANYNNNPKNKNKRK